jgi:hypothetical protein
VRDGAAEHCGEQNAVRVKVPDIRAFAAKESQIFETLDR